MAGMTAGATFEVAGMAAGATALFLSFALRRKTQSTKNHEQQQQMRSKRTRNRIRHIELLVAWYTSSSKGGTLPIGCNSRTFVWYRMRAISVLTDLGSVGSLSLPDTTNCNLVTNYPHESEIVTMTGTSK